LLGVSEYLVQGEKLSSKMVYSLGFDVVTNWIMILGIFSCSAFLTKVTLMMFGKVKLRSDISGGDFK